MNKKLNLQLFADELLGTWVFVNLDEDNSQYIHDIYKKSFDLDFISNGNNFSSIFYEYWENEYQEDYESVVYGGQTNVRTFTHSGEGMYCFWATDDKYKTITITNTSRLTNRQEFTTWLKANATKQQPKPKFINARHYQDADNTVPVFFDTLKDSIYNKDGTKANLPSMTDVTNALKTTMLKYNVKDDIYTPEFWSWCVNTPGVNNGALFSLEVQTETPRPAHNQGFPLLKPQQVIYGFYNGISANTHVIIITDSGNYKITNGTALTCEKINAEKGVTLPNPASATQGTLTAEEFMILKENDLNYIIFNNEIYSLQDKTITTDTMTYSHVGYENNRHLIKTISITMANRAWVLNETEVIPALGDEVVTLKFTHEDGTISEYDVVTKSRPAPVTPVQDPTTPVA